MIWMSRSTRRGDWRPNHGSVCGHCTGDKGVDRREAAG